MTARKQSIIKMGFRMCRKEAAFVPVLPPFFIAFLNCLAACRRACQHNNIGTCPTTQACTQPVDASHPVGGSPSNWDICGPFRSIRFDSIRRAPGALPPNNTNTNTSGYPTHSRPNPPHIAASELPPVILISLLPGNSTPLPHPTVTINNQPCRSPTSSSRTSSPTPACSGSGPFMTSPASSVPTAPASPTSWTPSPSSWACSPATSVRSR